MQGQHPKSRFVVNIVQYLRNPFLENWIVLCEAALLIQCDSTLSIAHCESCSPVLYDYCHYIDVIMTTMASQITSLAVVYSTVYSDADQRKHQSSASLAFVWGIHRDRWIPHTKGQLLGKCFHLMTSSWCGSGRTCCQWATRRAPSCTAEPTNSMFSMVT